MEILEYWKIVVLMEEDGGEDEKSPLIPLSEIKGNWQGQLSALCHHFLLPQTLLYLHCHLLYCHLFHCCLFHCFFPFFHLCHYCLRCCCYVLWCYWCYAATVSNATISQLLAILPHATSTHQTAVAVVSCIFNLEEPVQALWLALASSEEHFKIWGGKGVCTLSGWSKWQ